MKLRTQNKTRFILKYTLFFALLLPTIQGTQLYILFNMFNPILLVMPVVMGTITGFLVGYYRYKVILQISELQSAQSVLKIQVQEKTQELQETNEALQKALLLDPLTSLGNRLKLKEVLETEEKRIKNEYDYISFLMIDIDFFKRYNDYYGHLMGDDVLISLGKYFLHKFKDTETQVIRFGGEEFILIIPDCDVEKSKIIAARLVKEVEALNIEHIKSEVSENITLSIGIHTSESMENAHSIKKADDALYIAKEQGRNHFVHSESI